MKTVVSNISQQSLLLQQEVMATNSGSADSGCTLGKKKRKPFTRRIVQYWNRSPREVVVSHPWRILGFGEAKQKLICSTAAHVTVTCRRLDWRPLEVHSKQYFYHHRIHLAWALCKEIRQHPNTNEWERK